MYFGSLNTKPITKMLHHVKYFVKFSVYIECCMVHQQIPKKPIMMEHFNHRTLVQRPKIHQNHLLWSKKHDQTKSERIFCILFVFFSNTH